MNEITSHCSERVPQDAFGACGWFDECKIVYRQADVRRGTRQ
jgi:hypothetical protein